MNTHLWFLPNQVFHFVWNLSSNIHQRSWWDWLIAYRTEHFVLLGCKLWGTREVCQVVKWRKKSFHRLIITDVVQVNVHFTPQKLTVNVLIFTTKREDEVIIQTITLTTCMYSQGSHSDSKTSNNDKAFSSQGIFNRLEKSGKSHKILKKSGNFRHVIYYFLVICKWTVYYLLKCIKFSVEEINIRKYTGKMGEKILEKSGNFVSPKKWEPWEHECKVLSRLLYLPVSPNKVNILILDEVYGGNHSIVSFNRIPKLAVFEII